MEKQKKKREFPHTYVIIFALIVLSAILTWIVPGGEFSRELKDVNGINREVIVPGSFETVENQPQSWQIFSSIFEGMLRTKDIIFYILMIGGAFWIMNESKALDVAIYSFLNFTRRLEKIKLLKLIGVDNIIITLIMLCFSFFGAVIGMSEETIAFVVIFVPLAISMGYDSIVGVSMCFLGAGLGFAGALLNPFTIGIAQGLSGIQLFSGIEYRLVIWLVINVIGIGYVLRYAKKIKKNPKASPVYENDEYWRKKGAEEVLAACKDVKERLTKTGVKVEIDASDLRPGAKYYKWEMKGVPLRLEIGPRDLQNNVAVAVRRDSGEKEQIPLSEIEAGVSSKFEAIHESLYQKAKVELENRIFDCAELEEVKEKIQIGVATIPWCGKRECGLAMEDVIGAGILGIPLEQKRDKKEKCPICGEETETRVYVARTY